ncbi:uncharacterized protein ACHE_60442S [Aspergillus chevalieri]|uniref:Uncharacterized protein n=1 Tax=Aspergillus chevalieri TaxID=182096 RepID=A0A7R7VTN1_ASPCH|nr:uncharacterized protein ACHE_60442S [Aspergillus chevalieri]BCR90556.1 hypothetical protein ACHE_60442S [Aspergillus chevalieri]
MAPHSQPVGSDDKENLTDASSDLTEIFSDNSSDSDEDEDEDESNDDISNDEGQLPPEHFLAQAESLNISQLQQKRYSDTTQERLDETYMYWNR